MPPTTIQSGQAGSFLGLRFYTEAQSNSFFGRDAEIDNLTGLIELNTLTIVFGRSGTGKTSLLNAGVFPRLRKSFCLPFRIRLEFNDNSPDLISQIKKILKEEIDKYGFKVESYPGSETLWEYFHKEPLWKTVTPILVFDQFEEIFTLSKSNPRFALTELPAFWEELSDLIENNIPEKLKEKFLEEKEKVGYNYKKQKAKVVFSFREEYLPEFESITITTKIPSIKYSRFRLLPMNGNQAYEVITKTWKDNISAKEAKHLVSYFTNETGSEDYSLVTVEPSLLSQVCAYIDKERIETGGGKVSAELLSNYPKDTILRAIYDETVNAADNSLPIISKEGEERKNLIKEFIEEKLITTQGYRTKYHLTAYEEILKPGIYVLTARYLVREDDNVVELTHDVLAPIIRNDREKRRSEIEIIAAKQRARKKAIRLVLWALLIAGTAFAISTYFSSRAYNAMVVSNRKKAEADSAVSSLNKVIAHLKQDSIRLAKKGKKDTIYVRLPDSTIIDPYNSDSVALLEDSIRGLLEKVDLLDQELTGIKGELGRKNKIFDDLKISNDLFQSKVKAKEDSLQNIINDLSAEIERYRRDSIRSSTKIKELETTIKNLREQIRKLGETIKELMNRNPGSTFPGNLRVQIYDKSGEQKQPITTDTFSIYIIPYSGTNKTVLNNNKALLYQKDCNGFDQLISKLNGWQRAYFKDGYYYFHDVIKNGKYKVKICNKLDGYFNLQMPSPSGSVFWKLNEKERVEIKLGRF